MNTGDPGVGDTPYKKLKGTQYIHKESDKRLFCFTLKKNVGNETYFFRF